MGRQHTSSYRSRHSGFDSSISLSFHALFHFLIAFSRAMALIMVSWASYPTRVWVPYLLVKPSPRPCLCCRMR